MIQIQPLSYLGLMGIGKNEDHKLVKRKDCGGQGGY